MKRILIIDESNQILPILEKELRSLRNRVSIDLVGECENALTRIEQTNYDLLVVNDDTTEKAGRPWLQEIRESKPGLAFILLENKADGTLTKEVRYIGNIRVIYKPINPARFCKSILRKLPEKMDPDPLRKQMRGEVYRRIHTILVELFQDLGAVCIWLIDVKGCRIDRIGNADELPIGKIAYLMGSRSSPVQEIGILVDGKTGGALLTFCEGERFDVCMITVGAFWRLLMVFQGGVNCQRLGTIHFFGKQAAAAIASILADPCGEPSDFCEEVLIKQVIIKEADQFIEQLEGNEMR